MTDFYKLAQSAPSGRFDGTTAMHGSTEHAQFKPAAE